MKVGKRRTRLLTSAVAASAALVTTCAMVGSASAQGQLSAAGTPARGGSLTVLELAGGAGGDQTGVGTTTNTTALEIQSMMNAIYGELFELQADGKSHPDLASGWKLSADAKTFTIDIRKGVVFSDGTPFDAAAVVQNYKDDLAAPAAQGADPAIPVKSFSTPNSHTVVLHLKSPDGAILNQFQDSLFNWIASPTAEKKMGTKQFALTPVAAGPFMVVSDKLDSKLVLKANPRYWQKGHPYLQNLTFLDTASDEAALEALRSGGAQAYEDMSTPQLVKSYKSAGLQVTQDKGNGGLDVQINTHEAPFTNIKARQALYYATDSAVIDQKVYGGTCPLTQSFTGPAGLFYEPKVPGYPTYDLAKAKALVKQLGGLSFTMNVGTTGTLAVLGEVLQDMFKAAGMNVTLKTDSDLEAAIQDYNTHKWQIFPASIGAWDPADAIGVAFRLSSTAVFTGVFDPKVDALISQGVSSPTQAGRAKAYASLASYLAKQADTPFICSGSTWDVAAKGVSGPGLTSDIPGGDVGPEILWEDASVKNK